ncbi:MAG: glycerol-3-phosphate acyltransferase [Chloroflexi bacterium]|nr:glycerol-3-phosphate acyltransferase [Chloroflexota bacterium]
MLTTALAVLAAYLWGSVPTAYLVARYKRRVDVRRIGSGNVGASNIRSLMGARVGLLVGLFDSLGKGALPLAIAKLLGLSLDAQMAIGLAAVAGHNWSLYLRFTGGRGVSTSIGVLLALPLGGVPWELVGFMVVGVLGWLLTRSVALWVGIAMLLVPLWSFLRPEREFFGFSLALVVILLLKRLVANWQLPPAGQTWVETLLYRALYDRDTARALKPEVSRRAGS